jgi:hypothetical protein
VVIIAVRAKPGGVPGVGRPRLVATSVAARLAPATERVPARADAAAPTPNARTRAAPKAVRTTSAWRAAPAAAHMEDAAKGADGLAPARAATVSAPANHEDLVEATADDDHGACTPRAAPNALADADASALPRGTARRTREENILPSSPREVRAAVHSGPRREIFRASVRRSAFRL